MARKSLAFTLTEIALAMSIVGVVATLTLPTIMQTTRKKEYSTRLKTFYSRMTSAVNDAALERGGVDGLSVGNDVSTSAKATNWYMINIDPYYGHKTIKESGTNKTIYFKDGSSILISNGADCVNATFDTNGDKNPNVIGKDQYRFHFCLSANQREAKFGNASKIFGPFGMVKDASRNEMKEKCDTNANSTCSALLYLDDWEYKDDYPLSFN